MKGKVGGGDCLLAAKDSPKKQQPSQRYLICWAWRTAREGMTRDRAALTGPRYRYRPISSVSRAIFLMLLCQLEGTRGTWAPRETTDGSLATISCRPLGGAPPLLGLTAGMRNFVLLYQELSRGKAQYYSAKELVTPAAIVRYAVR